MLNFEVNKEKTLAALQFLICEANGRRVKPSQYQLVKAIFLADRTHLNKFGRPITFDQYVAMNHGPVPSFTYDVLKPTFNWSAIDRQSAPWTSEPSDKKHLFSVNTDCVDVKKLSRSDKKCLADGLGTVLSLNFKQIRRLTHEDPAYVAAWRDEEGTYAFPMDMALLLDSQDESAVEDVRYLAEMTAR